VALSLAQSRVKVRALPPNVRLRLRIARPRSADCPSYTIACYLLGWPDGHYILSVEGSTGTNVWNSPGNGSGSYEFAFEVEFY
jgi:hypothetical protein